MIPIQKSVLFLFEPVAQLVEHMTSVFSLNGKILIMRRDESSRLSILAINHGVASSNLARLTIRFLLLIETNFFFTEDFMTNIFWMWFCLMTIIGIIITISNFGKEWWHIPLSMIMAIIIWKLIL